MQRAFGIGRTVVAASAAIGIVVIAEFVVLVLLIAGLRGATRQARDAERVLATAEQLERSVLDLETGMRGYVITRQERFLQPWQAARRQYPEIAASLEQQLAPFPDQEARARKLARAIRAYERTWAAPVVRDVRRNPSRARAVVATGVGKAKVDAMRKEFDVLVASQRLRSEAKREHSENLTVIAIVVGLGALTATLALIALTAAFAFRLIVQPIGRLGSTTRRLARGDLKARAEPERARELNSLALEFNSMADALSLRRAELEAVLDSTTDGLLMADLQGRVVFVNAAMDRIWGGLRIQTRGPVWERMAALAQLTPEPEKYAAAAERLMEDPNAEFTDVFLVPTVGRSFTGRTAPVRDAQGGLLGRIFVLREVTAERESERLKDEFIATVSHELRTPLTSISGFVELLLAGEGGPLSDEQHRFLSVVERNADRLLGLVGDLLLIAQLDAHTLRLELEVVNIAEIASEAVEAARPAAEAAGLRLELVAESSPRVRADRARVGQVIDNLVSNAIKFTPHGGLVEVMTSDGEGAAVIRVRDTGPGMSEEETERLFARFYRTQRAIREQVPGTGLGLAISKAITDAHRGTITVSSREGEGTTFTVELPLDPVAVGARRR